MPRESKSDKVARAKEVYDRLLEEHPDAHCALDHESPFQLAVATIMSAQTTDERVNMVTPELFHRYPSPQALADADQEEVEKIIHSTGFYRNKAKNIIGFADCLVDDHGGEMPRTIKQLAAMPGVGRKTANVILGNAFDINEGVVVDTHIRRLSNRLGFTGTKRKDEKNVEKIERDLMKLFPRERWTMLAHLFIWHGRRVCDARKPECGKCVVADLCPSSRV